jgi:hypothetical protein
MWENVILVLDKMHWNILIIALAKPGIILFNSIKLQVLNIWWSLSKNSLSAKNVIYIINI